jgi:hypothetical protein
MHIKTLKKLKDAKKPLKTLKKNLNKPVNNILAEKFRKV